MCGRLQYRKCKQFWLILIEALFLSFKCEQQLNVNYYNYFYFINAGVSVDMYWETIKGRGIDRWLYSDCSYLRPCSVRDQLYFYQYEGTVSLSIFFTIKKSVFILINIGFDIFMYDVY